nr:ATP-dependent RecD-like DNA helicase [Anaerolineae bacterium]
MEQVTLEGTVERVTYYNEENGYSVVRIRPTSNLSLWSAVDENGLITVVGYLPELNPGENLEIEGTWQTHTNYGRQLQAINVRQVAPATVEGIRRYLGSGLIKGIGPKTAERIVGHFGLETLDILDHDTDRLYEVDGVGPHRVRLITRAWAEQQEIKRVMLFLQSHKVSTSLAVKIYKNYGDAAIQLVEEDPYRLARDIFGIGFRTADQIAQNLGLTPDHPRRLEAGLVYTLNQAADEGHVYLPRQKLIAMAASLLEVAEEDILPAVERAESAELVIQDHAIDIYDENDAPDSAVYLPAFYYSEIGSARRLRMFLETPVSRINNEPQPDWLMLIGQAASQSSTLLTGQQRGAVHGALTHKVSIITGGPGTGKTTTLQMLIAVLKAAGRTFALASPTGRAAKRLSEAAGHPARTIHRMLGYSPARGFLHNEDDPIPADMIIVDECSMLDQFLAYALLRAVDARSHLVMVGDVDQLPSVGAGDVLRDVIASGEVPVTRLDTIFRQAEDSLIIQNAHRINQGLQPLFPDSAQDFFLFSIADDPERAADLVVDIVQNRVPNRFGYHPLEDIQVIVPMYRGAVGVSALNERLQQALNPPGRPAEQRLGGRIFRVGDKVLQMRNNYDKEVFNGDVGHIRSFDMAQQEMNIVFDDRLVTYDWLEAHELTHAYAISVHRSQGSEYPVIVMPIVTQHYMLLQRNLLYTAVTRAKELVILVGSKRAIAIAVKNNEVSKRYTALERRLLA